MKTGNIICSDGNVINIGDFLGGKVVGHVENLDEYSPSSGDVICSDGRIVNVGDCMAEISALFMFSDGEIEPVLNGLSERLVLISAAMYAYKGYQVFAGETALSEVLDISEPFITAAGAFDSSELYVSLVRFDESNVLTRVVPFLYGDKKLFKLAIIREE